MKTETSYFRAMQVELNNVRANFLQAIQQKLSSSDVNSDDYDSIIQEFSHFILEHHVGGILYVLDHSVEKYLFVSSNCETVLGFERDEILKQGLSFLWDKMHPADRMLLKNGAMGSSYYEFVKIIPSDQLDRFTFTYNFRIQNSNNTYNQVLAQTKVLLRSADKAPLITLGLITDISDYKSDSTLSLKVSHYYPHTKKTKSNILFISSNTSNTLSKREIEILKLISEGARNKIISEQLNISIYTVRAHRRNILLKLECDSFTKAKIKAKAAGII